MHVKAYPILSIDSGNKKLSECARRRQPPNNLHATSAIFKNCSHKAASFAYC